MTDVRFTDVWERIEANAGKTFQQIRGGEFTYDVRSGSVWAPRYEELP